MNEVFCASPIIFNTPILTLFHIRTFIILTEQKPTSSRLLQRVVEATVPVAIGRSVAFNDAPGVPFCTD
jgi:hypothetical protein